MDVSDVRYATSTGGVDIAWQEFGDPRGPRVVWVSGFISHLDLNWEFPPYANLARGLGSRCRVLAFDKRGTGLSGRDLGLGSLAERADDVRAVMEAAGWDDAHLFGISEGGPISVVFAALHPERVSSLTLYGTAARFLAAPDFPEGAEIEVDRFVRWLERNWGTGKAFGPFFAHPDDSHQAFMARFERSASSPKVAAEIMRRNLEIDVRDILAGVRVPTLVAHATGDPIVPVAAARDLAGRIEGARYFEVEAAMHGSWRASDYAPFLDEIARVHRRSAARRRGRARARDRPLHRHRPIHRARGPARRP